MNRTRFVVPVLLLASLPAQWTLATPPATPGARAGHGMDADTAGNVLLFGGTASFQPLNQTWQWDGSTWTQLTPATSPGVRSMIEVVYDSARSRHVVFGGWTTAISVGNASNETWEYDGTDWTLMAPTTSPGGLWKYGACYDLVRSRLVLYGGASNGFPIALQNTWEYDGTTWAQVPGASSPGPIESPAMCFHAGINRTVMFGGINPQIGGVDTTWLYDGVSWTAANVAGPWPAVRTGAEMVYDPFRAVCVLFGGMNPLTAAPFTDTWEFDGTAWTQVPATASAGRAFGMAFDVARRQVVRHGGVVGSATNGETWSYGAQMTLFGAGCAGSNGTPSLFAASMPRLGEPWSLTMTGTVVSVPFAVLVFGGAAIGPIPLDVIGMTGCSAWISPDLLVTIGATGGVASWTATLPGSPALVGAHLYVQGLSFDPGINPASLTVSNALDALVGH